MVLGALKKQAEKLMRRKPVSSVSSWLLLMNSAPVLSSYSAPLRDGLWPTSFELEINPWLHQVAFGRGALPQ